MSTKIAEDINSLAPRKIKAIETHYKGYRFRSRLEARWAVFFDALGIEWEYETEGFDLGKWGKYLPDFWIKHSVKALADDGWGFWVEIKPNKIDEAGFDKVAKLAEHTGHNALIFQGSPHVDGYSITKLAVTHHKPGSFKLTSDLVFEQKNEIVHLVRGGFGSHPMVFGKDLNAAYIRASSARFEHGENGWRA